MAPFGKGRRRDLSKREVPIRAQILLALGGVTAALAVGNDAYAIYKGKAAQGELSTLARLASLTAVFFVSWSMEWRDEIEPQDGARVGSAMVFAACSELCGVAGLTAGRAVLGTLCMLTLAWRQSLGLRVATKRGTSMAGGRMPEAAAAAACIVAYTGIVLVPQIKGSLGPVAAWATLGRSVADGLAIVAAVSATLGERWPVVNIKEQLIGAGLMALTSIGYGHGLVLGEGSKAQAIVSCVVAALTVMSYSFLTVSAYRRTPAKASIF